MLDTFWLALETQHQALTSARSVYEALAITHCPGSVYGSLWAGDYDDFADALLDAGWRIDWHEPYWFTATDRQGDQLEYIEGDIRALVEAVA